jgi:hypothetical protein
MISSAIVLGVSCTPLEGLDRSLARSLALHRRLDSRRACPCMGNMRDRDVAPPLTFPVLSCSCCGAMIMR